MRTHGIQCDTRIFLPFFKIQLEMNIRMRDGLCHYSGAYVIESHVPDKSSFPSAESDTNRAGYIPHGDIGETEVFYACLSCADLNGTAIGFIDQAVGNGDVLALASAKTKNSPAGAEGTISDGHKFITAKKGTGIILTEYITVDHVYVFTTVEVKAIVVLVDAVVDVDAVYVNMFTLE
jgi:hypothetical protein